MFRKQRAPALQAADLQAMRQALDRWYRQPLGRLLLEQERAQIDAVLPNLFGYHLLQVGRLAHVDLLGSSRIGCCTVVDDDYMVLPLIDRRETCGTLCASAQDLPIATDSVDVILLPHTLEFSLNPHQVLREVDRTLIPEGHVVVLGFNPWSVWMGWRALLRWRKKVPWCGRFLGVPRLKDWLALLGYDVVLTQYYLHRPPLRRPRLLRRLRFLEALGARFWPVLGQAYILVAKKRTAAMTPLRQRWRPRRRLAPVRDMVGTSLRRAMKAPRKQRHD